METGTKHRNKSVGGLLGRDLHVCNDHGGADSRALGRNKAFLPRAKVMQLPARANHILNWVLICELVFFTATGYYKIKHIREDAQATILLTLSIESLTNFPLNRM